MAAVERSLLRIDRPKVQQGMTPQHRVRPLMPAALRGDFSSHGPVLGADGGVPSRCFSASTHTEGSRP
jgi:hypothetical protein